MNEHLTYNVIQAALDCGVREFIICAGSRNSSFVEALRVEERLTTYYWPEERSAAFFAIGRSRATNLPVAIVTTSGTAVGELMPAAMEAHYNGTPLLLITADRPRRFRGSGAPQSSEQVKLFGPYANFFQDIARDEICQLAVQWNRFGPAHLNVCLEEPMNQPKFAGKVLSISEHSEQVKNYNVEKALHKFEHFMNQAKSLLVIVSTLRPGLQEVVANFLLELGAPVMLEGVSGLREDPRLQSQRIRRTDKILKTALEDGYAIDSILRIGGIPTHRIWRELEDLKEQINVCAISELHFSGLSWNRWVICAPIDQFLSLKLPLKKFNCAKATKWMQSEHLYEQQLHELIAEEPSAEASLIHGLSEIIPNHAQVYLGNSLPIREWDLAAVNEPKDFSVWASRGLNGIDGQISTFLGLCKPDSENWAIVGDLTALYDLVSFWILPKLDRTHVNVVIVNNGGGKIFAGMFPYKEMLNEHNLNFESLAKMWGMEYERWESIPKTLSKAKTSRIIEVIPDDAATKRFSFKLATVKAMLPEEALVESL